jgi:putative salt-induced outer membrane protein YdiY
MLRRALVVLAALAAAAALSAAEDTPESSPTPTATPPRWSGEGGLSYVRTTGNSDNSTFGAGLKLVRERALWKNVASADFVRATDHSIRTTERIEAGVRAERALDTRPGTFVRGSYLRNVFAGIEGLETAEAGVLYKVAAGEVHNLTGSVSLSHSWEQRLAPEPNRAFFGVHGGLSYKLRISPTADLTEDADYLQSFDRGEDWRLGSKAVLALSATRVLGVKISHTLLHYNRPVPGKLPTDATVLASVVAKWPAVAK